MTSHFLHLTGGEDLSLEIIAMISDNLGDAIRILTLARDNAFADLVHDIETDLMDVAAVLLEITCMFKDGPSYHRAMTLMRTIQKTSRQTCVFILCTNDTLMSEWLRQMGAS